MRPTKLFDPGLRRRRGGGPVPRCLRQQRSSSGSSAHPTLTYWASNQGTSLQDDQQVLAPQIAKFTKQTGIKVKVQVIPWTTLLNQITAATVSGKGPDVLNIGNTWSASLQATGAFLPFSYVGHEHDRRVQPVPGRQPVGHRRGRQAADGRPALQHGLRPVLQQGRVRGGGHQRAARDLVGSSSRTPRS